MEIKDKNLNKILNNFYTARRFFQVSVVAVIYTLLLIISIMPVLAFEDCLITNDTRLTDIRIENNEIIDVYPLITILNDKNTLIVHPLKEGNTYFSVLKNGKEKIIFPVNVKEERTIIKDIKGFSIMPIDTPPEPFILDYPPEVKEWNK